MSTVVIDTVKFTALPNHKPEILNNDIIIIYRHGLSDTVLK